MRSFATLLAGFCLFALVSGPRSLAQDSAVEPAPPPETPSPPPEPVPGRWRVTVGFPVAHSDFLNAQRYPWGEGRGAISRFNYGSPDLNFQMDAAINDGGAAQVALRALTSHAGRFELRYRRTQRNFFDGVPMVLDRNGMTPAATAVYTRLIIPGADADGDWDTGAMSALSAFAFPVNSRLARDLFSLSFSQRLPGAGDFTIGVDLQKRSGFKPYSFLQSTGMQDFPDWFPNGQPWGELKAITAYHLPVEEREAGLRAGYVQQLKKFRLSASLGWFHHQDNEPDLNVANPWPARQRLTARLGQSSSSALGELNLAGRFGRHTLTLKSRLEEARADIPITDFIPLAPPFTLTQVQARYRRTALSAGWRAYAGDWEFQLDASSRHRYRTDLPVELPAYDHPLGGAQGGSNSPPPSMGLARTPRPMNETLQSLQAGLARALHWGGLPATLSVTATRTQRDMAWRAVPGTRENSGALDYVLTGRKGRMHLGIELARKEAPLPIATYYEVVFLGPDGVLMSEPGQTTGFVAADLLAGRRLTLRASGAYQFTPKWELSGEGKYERERFERPRVGLQSLLSRRAGLTLDGAFSEEWHWALYASGSGQEVVQIASKSRGIEAADPGDSTHSLPDVLSTRIVLWDLGQRLSWQSERWRLALEGNLGRVEETAALGIPLHLRTSGARFSAESKLGKSEAPAWSLGAQFDWRKIRRDEIGGDAVPGFSTPLLDPYNTMPAPDIFAPLSGLGPQGWVAGIFVRWQRP